MRGRPRTRRRLNLRHPRVDRRRHHQREEDDLRPDYRREFPAGMRVVSRRAAWSDDGQSVTPGREMGGQARAAAGAGRGNRAGGEGANASTTDNRRRPRPPRHAAEDGPPSTDNEMADVTVWHWKDAGRVGSEALGQSGSSPQPAGVCLSSGAFTRSAARPGDDPDRPAHELGARAGVEETRCSAASGLLPLICPPIDDR